MIGLLPPRLYCNNHRGHAAILPSRESPKPKATHLSPPRVCVPAAEERYVREPIGALDFFSFFHSASLCPSLGPSRIARPSVRSSPPSVFVLPEKPARHGTLPRRPGLAIYSRYLYAGIYEQIIIGGMFRHFSG